MFQASARWGRFCAQCGLALLMACVFLVQVAEAQLPAARLSSIVPTGGQQGKSFDVTITGSDLDDASKLHFSHAGITAVQKTTPPGPFEKGPQPVANQFTVSIAGNVPIGFYEARAVGRYGISSPRAFVVGELPEVMEQEPNNPAVTAAPLPFSAVAEKAREVALNNLINGIVSNKDDADYFKFTAKKGERVIIDCWAHRIDSKMDASLSVHDSTGRELGSSRDYNRRDPFLDLAVPADGVYVVRLWDSVYGGSNDYFYRLSISTTPYVDYILPTAGLPGTTGKFTIYGRNLPGGSPADGQKVGGRPLEKLTVDIPIPAGTAAEQLAISSLVEPDDVGIDGFEYRLKGPAGHSNPVLIGFARGPIVAEQEPNSKPAEAQRITVPCEYVGQFQSRGDQDWVVFEAKKGQVFTIEVIAKRQRSRTDPELIVQRVTVNKDGQESVSEMQKVDDISVNLGGSAFDTRSDDPQYRFSAPEDGNYRLLLKDLYLTGDPRSVYRVSIRPESPDFRLAAVPVGRGAQQNQVLAGVSLLRRGGQDAINVLAFRRDGFDGEIRISVQGLPAGVTCPEVVIGPADDSTALVFKADEKAAPWAGAIQIVGKAKIGDKEITRVARGGTAIWQAQVQNNQSAESRMTRDIALAVSGVEDAPFNVELAEAKVYETSRAGKLEIPFKATRRGDFKGAIALSGIGLPKNMKINNMNIDAGKSEANLKLDIPNNAPLGTYSFYLIATSQVPYKRNPEAAKQAEDAKKEIDEAVKSETEANKKATDAKTAAEKAAADAAAEVKKTAAAKTAADKAAADAAAALKTAEEKAKSTKEAAEKDAGNQSLVDAKAAAEKAAAETAAKAKAAEEAKAAADKAAVDAAAKAKTAEDAKAAATTAATEAAAKLKLATTAQTAAAKRVTDAAKDAKSNNVNAVEPTMPITISVAAAPITLGAPSPAKVKQGEKVEVALPIQRLFGYADPVDVEVTGKGVANVKIAKVTVPKDQNEAKVVIEAAANAPAGEHSVTLRGTAKLNGQNLTVDQPLSLTVEAVAAEAKK